MILYFDEDARPDDATAAEMEAAAVAALEGEGVDPENAAYLQKVAERTVLGHEKEYGIRR